MVWHCRQILTTKLAIELCILKSVQKRNLEMTSQSHVSADKDFFIHRI